ncbi:putative protein-synthesizing GTPase [Medicago truncatula]|uniref:Tr-type G domain-containing protein n=1 Tax=Medicago truncatula TaxID=3880 RepID=A0A396H6V2_MEDTR|nr:putative protein-synthesizing GTPase [Medicago truncatula]
MGKGASSSYSGGDYSLLSLIDEMNSKSARAGRAAAEAEAFAAAKAASIIIENPIRAPICSMLGHMGSGKTTLLDYMRGKVVPNPPPSNSTITNSATYFEMIPYHQSIRLPGLLFIDTPGQPLLTVSRSLSTALCDIAILVVDINKYTLQPQTVESIDLLHSRNKYFIVALNHIDQISGWKSFPNAPFRKSYHQQSSDAQKLFSSTFRKIIAEFKQYGIKADMFLNNNDILRQTVSIVPTSAISGEGLSDIKSELIKWTQKTMLNQLTYTDQLQCTVLDVKLLQGHGTAINVVLVNGVLHVGDQIALCGTQASFFHSIIFLIILTYLLPLPNQLSILGPNSYLNSSFMDSSSTQGT